MTRTLVLGLAGLTLLASAGAASACPYGDKSAQTTTQQQTSDSSQLPLPTTTGTTGSKTGG
ncbi:MAG TPA: hypothetical protein VMW18_18190 [Candidatus Binatia bacterium]|nr:hypothetical protein [Candidatus Binatia bacterium]